MRCVLSLDTSKPDFQPCAHHGLGAGTFPRLSKDKSPAQRVLLIKMKAVGEGWDSAQSGPHGTATRLSKMSGTSHPFIGKKSQSHLLSSSTTLITPALRSGIKHFYRAKLHLAGKKKQQKTRALGISGWQNEIEICRRSSGIGKEGTLQRDLLCLAFGLGKIIRQLKAPAHHRDISTQ